MKTPSRAGWRRTVTAATASALVAVLGITAGGQIAFAAGPLSQGGPSVRPERYGNPVLPANVADPSVIRAQDGFYYLYTSATHLGRDTRRQHIVPIWRSNDLTNWRYVGDALPTRPAWATDDQIWAPDVHYFNAKYYLYFTVAHAKVLPKYGSPASTAKGFVSAIGVATAPTLTGPWTEAGPSAGGEFSTRLAVPPTYGWCLDKANPGCYSWHFDSHVYQGPDGTRYLYEGSYFQGNRLHELAPDGLSVRPGTATQFGHNLRYEAAYLVSHTVNAQRYYYMLASQSNCCAGPNSPYSVVANRSTQPQGQISDHHGSPMVWAYGPPADPAKLGAPWDNPIWWNLAGEGGGYPVLRQNGNGVVGAGGQAVITDLSGRDWLVYHGIDQNRPWTDVGAPGETKPLRQLHLDPMDWTADGWPIVNGGDGPSRRNGSPVTRPVLGDSFNSPGGAHWIPVTGRWRAGHDAAARGYLRQSSVAGTAFTRSLRPARTGPAGYYVECDLRSASATGSYGCATSVRGETRRTSYVAAAVDTTANVLRVSNVAEGRSVASVATALPAAFEPAEWAHLQIVADGSQVTATLQNSDRNPLVDVVLPVAAPAGAVALFTDGAAAHFDNVAAAPRDTHVAVPSPAPAAGAEIAAKSGTFGGTVGAQWRWLREDPSLHGFAPTGALALTSNGNLDEWQRLNADATAAPHLPWTRNVLLHDAPKGDWMAETRMHFDPRTPNLSAGIMAYSDDVHHVANAVAWNGNLTQVTLIRSRLDPLPPTAGRCGLAGPSPGGNVAVQRYSLAACPPNSEDTSQEGPARLGSAAAGTATAKPVPTPTRRRSPCTCGSTATATSTPLGTATTAPPGNGRTPGRCAWPHRASPSGSACSRPTTTRAQLPAPKRGSTT